MERLSAAELIDLHRNFGNRGREEVDAALLERIKLHHPALALVILCEVESGQTEAAKRGWRNVGEAIRKEIEKSTAAAAEASAGAAKPEVPAA